MAFYTDLQRLYPEDKPQPAALGDSRPGRRASAGGRPLPGADALTDDPTGLSASSGPDRPTGRRAVNESAPVAATTAAADLPPEPYPGLRPFEPDEWAIFFGREPMIDEVIRTAGRTAPGGRPRRIGLRQVLAGARRRAALAGARPCRQRRAVEDGDRPARRRPAAQHRAARWPSSSARRRVPRAIRPLPGTIAWPSGASCLPDIQAALDAAGASLCLLVDQFEELFRWARDNREEAQLVTELLRLIAEGAVPRLFVILTMRSDYLGACAGFEGFAETVNDCQYLLPRMDDFALLRAIHEPALLYGGTVEPAVGDRLLFEARREQDPLPVLQHTLMRACHHARARHGAGEGWAVGPRRRGGGRGRRRCARGPRRGGAGAATPRPREPPEELPNGSSAPSPTSTPRGASSAARARSASWSQVAGGNRDRGPSHRGGVPCPGLQLPYRPAAGAAHRRQRDRHQPRGPDPPLAAPGEREPRSRHPGARGLGLARVRGRACAGVRSRCRRRRSRKTRAPP